MKPPCKVLLVDDDGDLCEAIAVGLRPRGFEFTWKASAEEAMEALEASGGWEWDVVVADVRMGGMSGLALCERIVVRFPGLPVVLMTGFASLETVVAAVHAGATDFVIKPFEMNVLALALDRVVRHRHLHADLRRIHAEVAQTAEVDGLLGDSPAMRRVFELIGRVAATEAPVLISGKSGTGKELVARALHRRGRRRDGPFVAVSCAAIPEGLVESELFGHVKGAFTDASSARRGLFLEASGGTLFLDEIADLSLAIQAKLLRVLQDRVVRPVGGDQDEPYDARLVTATQLDLETEVAEHRFREDLFYRIHVIHIELPPLCTRGNDVVLLARSFIARAAATQNRPVTGLSTAAAHKLMGYEWPGNVRELENCIERAVAMAHTPEVQVEDLPDAIREHEDGHLIPGDNCSELLSMEEVQRRHILRVLAAVGNNKTAAAGVLGLHPSTLYRKLEQYGYASRVLRNIADREPRGPGPGHGTP